MVFKIEEYYFIHYIIVNSPSDCLICITYKTGKVIYAVLSLLMFSICFIDYILLIIFNYTTVFALAMHFGKKSCAANCLACITPILSNLL